MRPKVTVTVLALLVPVLCWAKAYFAPIDEMIRTADVIAIVELSNIRPAIPERVDSTFKDLIADARFEEIIHGSPRDEHQVYIRSFFPCAPVSASSGRYLMFFVMRNGWLTSSNWHLSLRPIQEGKVEWFSGKAQTVVWEDLAAVRSQIEKVLARQ